MNFNPPLEDLERIFGKTQDEAHPFEVVLLGGEPFMRKDIVEVVEAAYGSFGDRIGLSTNGTLIGNLDDAQLERLKNVLNSAGTFIQVSLDSIDPKVNDKTRKPKSKAIGTDRVIAGLDALERHGIKFGIGMLVTKSNVSDAGSSAMALLSRYGSLVNINVERLQPAQTLDHTRYLELYANREERVRARRDIIEARDSIPRRDVNISGEEEGYVALQGEKTVLDSYGLKFCTAGLLRAGVLPNGDVVPCVLLRDTVLGNLYSESWGEIWVRSKERFSKLDLPERGQCYSNLLRDGSGRAKLKTKAA